LFKPENFLYAEAAKKLDREALDFWQILVEVSSVAYFYLGDDHDEPECGGEDGE
jgi:hypothetical protein